MFRAEKRSGMPVGMPLRRLSTAAGQRVTCPAAGAEKPCNMSEIALYANFTELLRGDGVGIPSLFLY